MPTRRETLAHGARVAATGLLPRLAQAAWNQAIFAGFMIMLSLALAHFTGQLDLSRLSWLWFTAFVGANLFQMGFTGFCPAASIFKMLGLKDSQGGASCAS